MVKHVYRGVPYHLWNAETDMEKFFKYFDYGPAIVNRGKGPYVYNQRGKQFINANSGLWNVALGYSREELVEAATEQMKELPYASSWSQAHPRAIELAAKLVEICGNHYQHVLLGSNGSEVVEAAIKMVRQFFSISQDSKNHNRYKIISLEGSYHGFTYGAISTAGSEVIEQQFGPLIPGFKQIAPPYCYRCPFDEKDPTTCGIKCAQALEELIIAENPETVAAFIVEPVMGDFGVVVPPDEFHRITGEICKKYGVLRIADEITTGFGRTGKLFYSQDWEIQPDILLLGKAITSGYQPLSALLTTEEIFQQFYGSPKKFAHGATNSGHPVAAAVALKNIDILISENLAENSRMIGEYLLTGFKEIQTRRSIVGDVRGIGLMIALELVTNQETKEPIEEDKTFDFLLNAINLGLVMSYAKNGLRLFPPLITDQKLADEILEIVDKSLDTRPTHKIAHTVRAAKELIYSKT